MRFGYDGCVLKKKRRKTQILALIISRIFDPIVIIPATLAVAVWWSLVNGERVRFMLFILLLDVVLPGFVMTWFVTRGKVLSGWDVRDREERIPLFFFVTLAHAVGVVAAWFLEIQPIAIYLTAFWLLTVVYAMVTLFWKISVHVGVMSAWVTFVVMHQGPGWVWLYLLVLLMIWARVEGRYHRLSQALVGGVVPILVLPLVFMWFGVI